MLKSIFDPLAGLKGDILFSKNNKNWFNLKNIINLFRLKKCETSFIFSKDKLVMNFYGLNQILIIFRQ